MEQVADRYVAFRMMTILLLGSIFAARTCQILSAHLGASLRERTRRQRPSSLTNNDEYASPPTQPDWQLQWCDDLSLCML